MATSIRLPAELEQRLDDLAARTGRTKAFYLRQAIAEYLDDMEDLYLAEKELQAVREGASPIYLLEEVMRVHGVDD